jgi:NAD(P)-dependent dehydrogenase (short-subunit alcohol dehydrogenase family)
MKKILVTGGNGVIGTAFINRNKSKFELFTTTRNSNPQHNGIRNFSLDLNKPDFDVLNDLPEIDGLVYAAGVTAHVPVKYLKPEQMQDIFSVNYFGAVYLIAYLLKQKKLKNGASLVFLGSVASQFPYFGGAAYTSSKKALEGYSVTLALEMQPKEIRSNIVSPVFVESSMADTVNGFSDENMLTEFRKRHPHGVVKADEVCEVIEFLLSDQSKQTNGQNLQVGYFNTGMHA